MRILFYLGHPAHYHLYKNTIKVLKENGHQTQIIIKTKDILEELLNNDGINYYNILPKGRAANRISIFIGLIVREVRIAKFLKRNKIDIMVGSEPAIAHNGKLFGIPTIITVEDDTHIIPYFAYLTYPFTNAILAPSSCNLGKWNFKKTGYDGFQKLAYLHPKYFKPNMDKIKKLAGNKKYFLIRLSKLSAHHDFNIKGISDSILKETINILQKYGNVYITSEREIEQEFEKYRININVNDIHHVLYYAEMLIGDSQSMTVEAANTRHSKFAIK